MVGVNGCSCAIDLDVRGRWSRNAELLNKNVSHKNDNSLLKKQKPFLQVYPMHMHMSICSNSENYNVLKLQMNTKSIITINDATVMGI